MLRSMRIVYFGTAELSAALLEVILSDRACTVVGVVSKPDKPQGRHRTPVATALKRSAERHGCLLFQPIKASEPSFLGALRELQPDLCVVVAYGELLKEELLSLPRFGTINVHFSLLPAYRGAAPMQRALMDGVEESGVSIIRLVREMDAGPVYGMKKVEVPLSMTTGELSEALCTIGGELLVNVIHELAAGTAHLVEQEHQLASYAPKLTVDDCFLNWSQSGRSLHNLVRAANPSPGAWGWLCCCQERKRIKVWKTALIEGEIPLHARNISGGRLAAGKLFMTEEGSLAVACGEGALQLLALQLEGKKIVSGDEFVRGQVDLSQLSLACER